MPKPKQNTTPSTKDKKPKTHKRPRVRGERANHKIKTRKTPPLVAGKVLTGA